MDNKNIKTLQNAQFTFLDGSMLWSKGALFQGKRLLSVLEQIQCLNSEIAENPNDFFRHADQLRELTDTLKYEENFFRKL